MRLRHDMPEVVRLRAAVEEMNDAERALVEGLPSADAGEAKRLAAAVADARENFGEALDAVNALPAEGEGA